MTRVIEYKKNIKLINKGLKIDEFIALYDRVTKLDKCILSKDKTTIYFSNQKSIHKTVFSIDAGCDTSEYNAFIMSIKHYCGTKFNKVSVQSS